MSKFAMICVFLVGLIVGRINNVDGSPQFSLYDVLYGIPPRSYASAFTNLDHQPAISSKYSNHNSKAI